MSRSARGSAARRRGARAEWIAVWLLRAKGFRILERDLRSQLGEIDLVARRGGLLIFVEVKARAGVDDAAHSIRARQRGRITRAAQAYLAARPELRTLTLRFDAMVFGRHALPRHIADAWRDSS